jgi:rhodanese-related sulfurtransferase
MPTRRLDPQASHSLLTQGWTYLDVRTVEEYSACHPSGAWNIPVMFRGGMGMEPNPTFVAAVQRHFAPSTKLVVGCASGRRSTRACELLAAAGYGELVDVAGGFAGGQQPDGSPQPGWQECGLPCSTKPEPERTWDRLKS